MCLFFVYFLYPVLPAPQNGYFFEYRDTIHFAQMLQYIEHFMVHSDTSRIDSYFFVTHTSAREKSAT